MISVTPHSNRREDRAGDPLDGLVNLFDLGIVLSVAFLLAALSSLHLGSAITRHGLHANVVKPIMCSPGRRSPRCRSLERTRSAAGSRRASCTGSPTASSSTYSKRRSSESAEWATSGSSCDRRFPLISSGNAYILNLTWVTIKVAVISTSAALVIGLPIGLALGLGRFRGRRALQILANASLALPPVIVGIAVLILLLPEGAFGSLRIEFTLHAVYVAQTILALPYIVALTPAAIQGLPPGLLAQARALGAGRRQLSLLALREAKIGVIAAVIAALGAALSEVGAVDHRRRQRPGPRPDAGERSAGVDQPERRLSGRVGGRDRAARADPRADRRS